MVQKKKRIVSRPHYKIVYKKRLHGRERRDDELVPNTIRQWRKFRGWPSQMSLAKAAKVSPNTVHRLESGKLAWSPYTLGALAPVLQCLPGDLISLDPLSPQGRIALLVRVLPLKQRRQMLAEIRAVMPKSLS